MKKAVLTLLFLIALTGCAKTTVKIPEQMPDDFAIRFSWAIGAENIYDTYTGQIQKDLVLDGVAVTEFEPDREVLEEIYRKVTELDLASIDDEMTSASLTTNGEMAAMTPLTVYEIQFTINGSIYSIRGDATASCYPENNEAARFMEFVDFMSEILTATPEYQQLPEHSGGYD